MDHRPEDIQIRVGGNTGMYRQMLLYWGELYGKIHFGGGHKGSHVQPVLSVFSSYLG